MKNEELCPCKSGKTFGECCGPVIHGAVKAETAEALMRARYSSYVSGDVGFLRTSSCIESQGDYDEKASRMWSECACWHGLEIIKTEEGGPDDPRGVVEFRALYTSNGEFCNHHEIATFVRENGEWKFEDGRMVGETPIRRESPKVNRNDPCPCGSGKKYKKCCGAK